MYSKWVSTLADFVYEKVYHFHIPYPIRIKKIYVSSIYDDFKSQNCPSERGGGGCGGTNSNFPYRKLFTPDLNVFSLYKSYYSILHILHRWNTVLISTSQMIHLDSVNDTFRPQKQYVYEFQLFRLSDFANLILAYK